METEGSLSSSQKPDAIDPAASSPHNEEFRLLYAS